MAISAVRRLCVPFLVVAVTIALLALSSGGSSKAQWIPNVPQFQPEFDFRLCNDLPATFSGPATLQGTGIAGGGMDCTPNTTGGSNADISTKFFVPRGHLAYDQSYFVTAGGASETRLSGAVVQAAGGPNPDGTGNAGGGLVSDIQLGLAANPCNNAISPDFIWWDSETDTSDAIACAVEGTNNRWNNMQTDGGDIHAGQADAASPIVTQFPDCTANLFDPDGPGGDDPVQPNWRGAGLTQVPNGGDWQMLQNIEFNPGDLAAAFASNKGTTRHPFTRLDASLGYTNVIVLNDPNTVILQPNPISDFCTDLGTMGMIKGIVGGTNRVTQPTAPGSYQAQARTQSYRDADRDGIENNFDTCAWTANTDDPYTTSGADFDMLDPACDPFPGAKVDDQDGDLYLNPQDWCPQNSNPLPAGETDNESNQDYDRGGYDGGPPQDAIGDDCDPNPTWSNGLFFDMVHDDRVCIGETDADIDGWCAGDDANDASAAIPAPNPSTKVDFDKGPDAHSDTDGYNDALELFFLGTDPNDNCPNTAAKNDEDPDAWPVDFNDDQWSNILDIVQLTPPAFNSSPPNPNYVPRKDLNGDGSINILDIVQLTPPTFNSNCLPPPPP